MASLTLQELHFYLPSPSPAPPDPSQKLLSEEPSTASAKKGRLRPNQPLVKLQTRRRRSRTAKPPGLRNKVAETRRTVGRVDSHPLLPPLYDDGELVENAKMLF